MFVFLFAQTIQSKRHPMLSTTTTEQGESVTRSNPPVRDDLLYFYQQKKKLITTLRLTSVFLELFKKIYILELVAMTSRNWSTFSTELQSWSELFQCLYINPPTDRPFETIQNFHFQKCPLVLYTHGDTISVGSKLCYHSNPFKWF